LVSRNKAKARDITLKDILPSGSKSMIAPKMDVLPSRLKDSAFLTSMVSVFNAEPTGLSKYFSENIDGDVQVEMSTLMPRDGEGKAAIALDKAAVRKLIKESGEDLGTLKKAGNTEVLAVRALEVAVAERSMVHGASDAASFKTVEDMDVANSLWVLTDNKAESFTIEDCTPEPEKPCQTEAYTKIADALNRKDPVVFTKPNGEHAAVINLLPAGSNAADMSCHLSYGEVREEPVAVTQKVDDRYTGMGKGDGDYYDKSPQEGDVYVPSGSGAGEGRQILTPVSREGGVPDCYVYEEQSLNQAGARVTIGHIDNSDARSFDNGNINDNPVELTPQITPSPRPTPYPQQPNSGFVSTGGD
jgi:hypothetical protein